MKDHDTVSHLIAGHRDMEGPLLPILHAVQAACGHISEAAIRQIAEALNLTRAEVYGVVSFYHDFRTEPRPEPALKLCQGEACQARGVRALVQALTAAERARLEPVYCLGLCAAGPAAMTPKGEIFARLDASGVQQLLEGLS